MRNAAEGLESDRLENNINNVIIITVVVTV